MNLPKVYADFHNADSEGRLRLNCIGTVQDLSRQKIQLREGLQLTLFADDVDNNGQRDEILTEGTVTYSAVEKLWVAIIDWDAIRHPSDVPVL